MLDIMTRSCFLCLLHSLSSLCSRLAAVSETIPTSQAKMPSSMSQVPRESSSSLSVTLDPSPAPTLSTFTSSESYASSHTTVLVAARVSPVTSNRQELARGESAAGSFAAQTLDAARTRPTTLHLPPPAYLIEDYWQFPTRATLHIGANNSSTTTSPSVPSASLQRDADADSRLPPPEYTKFADDQQTRAERCLYYGFLL